MSKRRDESFEQDMHSENSALHRPDGKTLRLAVLISGSGSNLQALIDAIEDGTLTGVEIALVVSNNAQAQGVQRALKHKIPVIYLPWTRSVGAQFIAHKKMPESEERLTGLLRLFEVDLTSCTHFVLGNGKYAPRITGCPRCRSVQIAASFTQQSVAGGRGGVRLLPP